MKWSDQAIILRTMPQGESGVILWVFTENNGVMSGHVRVTKKNKSILQIGNIIEVEWSGRLETQLGKFNIELKQSNSYHVMRSKAVLYMINSITHMLYSCLAPADAHPRLYHYIIAWFDEFDGINETEIIAHYIKLELLLLDELGYGLSLDKCVVTKQVDGLSHVSPKSGGAVCRNEAAPYLAKLLKLPEFLTNISQENSITSTEIIDGLKLTGYFLENKLYADLGQELPHDRKNLYHMFESDFSMSA